MLNIVNLPIESLRPNDYNSNMMTGTEFKELVSEVKRLQRIPKPIVVKKNRQDYLIIDGEHNWRAAQETGLKELPCEIIEADDFESMLQTFKRNQHGTHNPIKLGKMFQRMMEGKGLSQRALAKEMDISEGTVRNALEYAKAVEVRNDYAFEKLSIPQIRTYNRLPHVIADFWLKCGADTKQSGLMWGKYEEDEDFEVIWGPDKSYTDPIFWQDMENDHSPADFKKRLNQISVWKRFEHRYSDNEEFLKELRKYTKHFYAKKFPVRDKMFMDQALDFLIDVGTDPNDCSIHPISFNLTSEEFEKLFLEFEKTGGSAVTFSESVQLAIAKKTGKLITKPGKAREGLKGIEISQNAPDYIRESKLPIESKYNLWKTDGPESKKRELALGDRYISEDRIKGELRLASKKNEYQEKLRTKSEMDLAKSIALRMPIYGKEKDSEAIDTMARRLVLLTKTELMILNEYTEGMEGWKSFAEAINGLASFANISD
jgi:ParB/RepB/Spo0J family partition protein